MKLEDQVVSLDLAKRLKELGVRQESFWAWYEAFDRDDTPRLNRSDEQGYTTYWRDRDSEPHATTRYGRKNAHLLTGEQPYPSE